MIERLIEATVPLAMMAACVLALLLGHVALMWFLLVLMLVLAATEQFIEHREYRKHE